MGYFANLYVVQAETTNKGITIRTMIYCSENVTRAYFCWGPGERPSGLFSFAEKTVFCDTELRLLPGYPLDEGFDHPDQCLVEANFSPQKADDPVLFHIVLPKRFIPRRDMKPLEQPDRPFVYTMDERVIATYPVIGPAAIRFWITRIGATESIADYELHKLLHPDEERPSKIGFEFNLGIFKLKYG
jgi:hypothetical protein